MYTRFFGFKERPFQLVPNPAYLYLSKGHEEALAHLQCAVLHEDGFVAITGEAGTGKTTLCRSFLENLAREVEAAYIFNPRLDAVGLLKAINEELGIEHTADAIKPLIDTLNQYLMAQHAQGKKVLLIIDEAQNLGRDVLEQLRLLSNLETTRHKLLQIILVGQPELGDLLDSRSLRQLRQRITLYTDLAPFTFKETREYIEHRIRVAAVRPAVRFTPAACRRIHRFAGGIPRLINIACDRALLCAFGRESRTVSRRIAGEALNELRYPRRHPKLSPLAVGSILVVALICVLTVLAVSPRLPVFSASSPSGGAGQEAQPEEKPRAGPVAPAPMPPPPLVEETKPATDAAPSMTRWPEFVTDIGRQADPTSLRQAAAHILLTHWLKEDGINAVAEPALDNETYFRLAAGRNHLEVLTLKNDLTVIERLNLPTILELVSPEGERDQELAGFAVLEKIADGAAFFAGGAPPAMYRVPVVDVRAGFSGRAFVFWKNFSNLQGTISSSAPPQTVLLLKMYLKEIGFPEIDPAPVYDPQTRWIISRLQAKHGVLSDGLVGPQTKIILYNENRSLDIPFLSYD